MTDIFVSYSRQNAEFALRFKKALEAHQRSVWMDLDEIRPAADWWGAIRDGIDGAHAFVPILTPELLSSAVCTFEMDYALKNNKRIIVLMRDESFREKIIERFDTVDLSGYLGEILGDADLSAMARHNRLMFERINWIYIRETDDFDEAVKTFLLAVDTDLARVQLHTRILRRSREWEEQARDSGYLLVESELREAENWLRVYGTQEPQATALQRDYIQASLDKQAADEAERARQISELNAATDRAQASSQKARRNRRVAEAVTVLAVAVALIAGLLINSAVQQQREANSRASDAIQREASANQALTAVPPTITAVAQLVADGEARAESLRLANEASAILANPSGNLEAAVLLGIRALRTAYTPQADELLVQATDQLPTIKRIKITGGFIQTVTYSPDGDLLATALTNKRVELWDTRTWTLLHTFEGHNDVVNSVDFSPSGRTLVSADHDGTMILWDVQTHQELQRFVDFGNTNIQSVVFTPDEQHILSGAWDTTVQLWDIATGESVLDFEGHVESVNDVTISPDGRMVAAAADDGRVIVWLYDTATRIRTFEGHTAAVKALAFSPDSQTMVSVGQDSRVILWDVQNGQIIHQFIGHDGYVTGVVYINNGQELLTADSTAIIRWDIASRQRIQTLTSYTVNVNTMTLSPDGNTLVSGSSGDLLVWDIGNQQNVRVLPEQESAISHIALSPDGRTALIVAHDSDNPEIIVWDVTTRQTKGILSGHIWAITQLIIAPDNKTAYSAAQDNTVIQWDLEQLTAQAVYVDFTRLYASDWVIANIKGAAIHYTQSPVQPMLQGTAFVAPDTFDTLVVLDPLSGQVQRRINTGQGIVRAIARSSDGTQILTAGDDDTVMLWDAASGQMIHKLEGHLDMVTDVAFLPDNQSAISSSHDATMILWDLRSGQIQRIFRGHDDYITQLEVMPDGKHVISGSYDRTVRIWEIDYHDFIAYACTRVTKDFTPDERIRYGIVDDAPTCPQFVVSPSD